MNAKQSNVNGLEGEDTNQFDGTVQETDTGPDASEPQAEQNVKADDSSENTESGEKPFILNIYDLNGKELARKPMDFMFETVEFSGNQVSFYNRNELCVFGLDGTEKFRGTYEEHTRQLFALDTKLYVAADEDGITWFRLK